LRGSLRKVEPTSTSPKIAGPKKLRDMFISGYVTMDSFSCNLYRNKIATQVAKKVAQCKRAFIIKTLKKMVSTKALTRAQEIAFLFGMSS